MATLPRSTAYLIRHDGATPRYVLALIVFAPIGLLALASGPEAARSPAGEPDRWWTLMYLFLVGAPALLAVTLVRRVRLLHALASRGVLAPGSYEGPENPASDDQKAEFRYAFEGRAYSLAANYWFTKDRGRPLDVGDPVNIWIDPAHPSRGIPVVGYDEVG